MVSTTCPNERDIGAEQTKTEEYVECIAFRRNADAFGIFSNMYPTPLVVDGVKYRTAEALYQCLKFPHTPEAQEAIRAAQSPMDAKRISRRFAPRKDWDTIRVGMMKFVLKIKAEQHERFKSVLLSTGEATIVESSSRDDFWGAIPHNNTFSGKNVLGKLLMQLRADLRESQTRDDLHATA